MRLRSAYREDEYPATPMVEAALHDPRLRRVVRVAAKVDTGFSGSLLITPDAYSELGLAAYEEPRKAVAGRVVTGAAVPLHASQGILEVDGHRIPCAVYTGELIAKPLVGRELLNQWWTLLDGPKKMLEIEL